MGIQDVAPAFRNPPTFNDFGEVSAYLKDNINKIARSLQDIDFMINGTLDVNNIRAEGIEARSIKAEAITTEKLQAGSITTDKIQAGAVVADKIDVGELSAISANLGHIVAGLIESVEIFGSYIATRRNAFPRCEMSATGNVFGAFNDANNHITIDPNYGGSPSLVFMQNGILRGRIDMVLGSLELYGLGALDLGSSGTIFINTPRMNFDNWDVLYANNPGRTLGDELREIFDRIEALEGG
ncbi:hypothetical protein [Paenibacillus sp. FSL R5-0519]|uniref:hypothetical protein n=1 Tax=Paenibacillus sp. FSL R5-0519 TaxID=2921648 RepID=UPI0030D74AEB